MLRLKYKMKEALDHMPPPPSYQAEDNLDHSQLKKTAEKVLATSFYAGSTAVSTIHSDQGDHLQDESKAIVEGWIQTLEQVERDTGFVDVRKAPTSVPSEASQEDNNRSRRSSSNTSVEIDSTFDIKIILVKNLSNQGGIEYDRGNYEQATKCFESALQLVDKFRKDLLKAHKVDLANVHFKLALIYMEDDGKLSDSERHFLQAIDESTNKESEIIYESYLKLAQLYLSQDKLKEAADFKGREAFLESAEKYSTKAANGCGQHLGNNSSLGSLYYKAVQLLAKTYSLQGYQPKADAILLEIPEQLREVEKLSPPTNPAGHSSRRALTMPSRLKPHRSILGFRRNPASDSNEEAIVSPISANADNDPMSVAKYRRESSLSLRTSPTIEDPLSSLASAGFNGDFNAHNALIWAIEKGSERVVHMLLTGYKVNVKRRALGFGTPERTIEKKANPNGIGKGDNLPLMVAIKENRVMIAKNLLDCGADVSLGDDKRRTALFLAAEYGRTELIKLIPKQRVPLECNMSNTLTPLHIASKMGHEEVVLYLLEAGANVNKQDPFGATALKLAAGGGHEAVVKTLVFHRAAINVKDGSRFSALMACIRQDHLRIAHFLLQHDASYSEVNSRNESPLMIAVQYNREEAVKLLIEKGADVETPDVSGWTPLITACSRGHKETVQVLIDAGAKVNRACAQGSTALDHARANKRRDIENMLERKEAVSGSRMVQPRIQMAEAYRGYVV